MAKLKPPAELELTGNVEDHWRRFKQRFDLYLLASGQDKASGERKVALLLTVAGAGAIDVFNSFQLTDADQKNFATVVTRFDTFCTPKRNETFERYVFNSRCQAENESVEEFILDLKLKSQSCNFGELASSLIKDRIVIGVRDKHLREKLLEETDLTLEKAIQICQARELTQTRIKSMDGDVGQSKSGEAASDVDRVAIVRHKVSTKQRQRDIKQNQACVRCGGKHMPRQCPAYGKECHACGMKNHFSRVCRQQKQPKVHHIEEEDGDSDVSEELFVGAVELTGDENEWTATYSTNGTDIAYKLDTGAQVNIIPETALPRFVVRPDINELKKVKLRAYSGEAIPTLGTCKLVLDIAGKPKEVPFVVVKGNRLPIIGLKSCAALGLVKRIHVVTDTDIAITTQNGTNNVIKGGHTDREVKIEEAYPDVFQGMGKLKARYKIELEEPNIPVIHAPRKVPLILRGKLKAELERLEKLDIIEKVEEPTEWVHSLVIVEKKDGSLRLCIDPKELNKYVKREHFQLPTRGDIIADIAGAKYFSKLDASAGFHQVGLDKASSRLCTFNTPFGRYSFKRLPFGLSSSPEVFHRTVQQIFEKVPGAKVYIDDVLIWGNSLEEHNERLKLALEAARASGLKLNADKCQYRQTEITFLGEKLTQEGVQIDESKVTAISNMPAPTDKEGVQRFLGMVNYVGKFVPNLATHTSQMRSLLGKNTEWAWDSNHQREFDKLKELISKAPVLRFYDERRNTKISADASKAGIGAVLLQQYGARWRPVAYASRALTTTECNYAQIEKEALALAYACKKFHVYIYGKKVWAETDHKPLVTIAKKGLAFTPPRVQRLFLSIQKYDLQLDYKPGKELLVADTLSRAFDRSERSSEIDEMVHVNIVRKNCSVSDKMWKVIATATTGDTTIQRVIQAISGGLSVQSMPVPYSQYVDELSVIDGILFKGSRIVVPQELQKNMLGRIHEGHLGIEKSKRRAKAVLYWPNMGADIERFIGACETCQTCRDKQRKEPLWVEEGETQTPWSKVGIDLFTLSGKDYVLVMDYYSHFPEIALLRDTTASQVILQVKSILARHGIPSIVRSDNGPCFNCAEFRAFAQQYGFKHITSSPNFPQSNGLVENGVKIVKRLLKKATMSKSDPYLALLTYRSTPLKHGLSPAEMLFTRKVRTTMPDLLETAKGENDNKIQEGKQSNRNTQKRYYDKGAKELSELNTDDRVRLHNGKNWSQEARVLGKVAHRSYEVMTPEGVTYRRNRRHLLWVPGTVIERQLYTQPNTPEPDRHSERHSQIESQSHTQPSIPVPHRHTRALSSNTEVCEEVQRKRSDRVVKSPQRLIKEM